MHPPSIDSSRRTHRRQKPRSLRGFATLMPSRRSSAQHRCPNGSAPLPAGVGGVSACGVRGLEASASARRRRRQLATSRQVTRHAHGWEQQLHVAIAQLKPRREIDALRRGSSAHQLSARLMSRSRCPTAGKREAARDARAYQRRRVEAARRRRVRPRARPPQRASSRVPRARAGGPFTSSGPFTTGAAAERLAAMAERERGLLKELSLSKSSSSSSSSRFRSSSADQAAAQRCPHSPAATQPAFAMDRGQHDEAFPNPVTASPPSPPTANADSGSAGSDGLEPEGDVASGDLPVVSSPPAQGLVLPNMGLVLPESLVASSWSPPSASSTSSARSTHSLRSTRAMPMSPLPLAPPPRGLEAMLQSAQREIEGLHDVVRQQMHVQGVLERRAAVLEREKTGGQRARRAARAHQRLETLLDDARQTATRARSQAAGVEARRPLRRSSRGQGAHSAARGQARAARGDAAMQLETARADRHGGRSSHGDLDDARGGRAREG